MSAVTDAHVDVPVESTPPIPGSGLPSVTIQSNLTTQQVGLSMPASLPVTAGGDPTLLGQNQTTLPMDMSDVRLPHIRVPGTQVQDRLYMPAPMPNAQQAGFMSDKFDGTGFKTWFEKMLFFLTVMCMERFLKETRPVVLDPTNDTYGMSVQQAWDKGDYLCQAQRHLPGDPALSGFSQ